MNQIEYGSMEGSIVHMDRVGHDDDSYYSDNRDWLFELKYYSISLN